MSNAFRKCSYTRGSIRFTDSVDCYCGSRMNYWMINIFLELNIFNWVFAVWIVGSDLTIAFVSHLLMSNLLSESILIWSSITMYYQLCKLRNVRYAIVNTYMLTNGSLQQNLFWCDGKNNMLFILYRSICKLMVMIFSNLDTQGFKWIEHKAFRKWMC